MPASGLMPILLMIASGFAGLGYQIVWTQQGALWLGHEAAAVLAVVTAFFAGLAFGSGLSGTLIERTAHPVRWYVGCELAIAVWGLVLARALSPFSAAILALTGPQPSPLWQWTVAFGGTFLMLLPATAAMGATLPAMERLNRPAADKPRSLGALYAANTFGATAGVLLTAFWIIPQWGLRHTAILCATLNILCAIVAWRAWPRAPMPLPPKPEPAEEVAPLLRRLAFTGLLGIGYEVLVVRVLSQVSQDTVYTFAMLLAVYLIGTTAGAAVHQRWLVRRIDAGALSDQLLGALAGTCLIGTATLWTAEAVRVWAASHFGPTLSAALASEALLALLAFGLPTLVMGALFSHLVARAAAAGLSFGCALSANTLGASAAPLLFAVIALPLLGPKASLLLVCLGYVLLVNRRGWKYPYAWIPAVVAIVGLVFAPALAFIDVPTGGHVVSYRDGVTASVGVVEDMQGVLRLRIDNRQQEGSSTSLRVDGRQAWLPLLLHPAPRRVLFLGLGTGVTASAAAQDPGLQVDAVELLPEVIDASGYFRPLGNAGQANPRPRVWAGDARRYVRTSSQRYDVIVSDNFHPARSGSGSLYTVEHFRAVRDRLTAGGLFCQWLPLHQLDLDTLRSIVRSFRGVFRASYALIASNSLETPVIGLLARVDGHPIEDIAALRTRLEHLASLEVGSALGIEDEFALLGAFVAGPASLQRFAADAPLNTDDRPVVVYRAPRITYAPDSAPHERLLALLGELSLEPTELFAPDVDPLWSARLAAYWSARDRFLEVGRGVQPSPDVRTMLRQVEQPLLSVLEISPDFRPAYDPLLMMAAALSRTDQQAARLLFTRLAQLQPERPEAQQALRSLAASSQ